MARSTPVHSGYTIINGSGTGPNGDKIDVWIEYAVISQDVVTNQSRIIAYFYACLNPSFTSSTYGSSGRNSSLNINGSVSSASGGYDFRSSSYADRNLYGTFDGYITHNEDGTKTISVSGSFTTPSSYITGGNVSGNITLSTINRGLVKVKISTGWVTGRAYANVGGVWKLGQVFTNVGGVWKRGMV